MSRWLVIGAHGMWVPGESFTVPEGMTLKFLCHHGIYMIDDSKIDRMAKKGTELDESLIAEVLQSGEECHEYLLSYPRGLNLESRGSKKRGNLYNIQKGEDVLFSSVLGLKKVKACDTVYLYACRSAPRQKFIGKTTKKEIKKMKKQFAENSAAMKDIEEFMEDRTKWELKHLGQ